MVALRYLIGQVTKLPKYRREIKSAVNSVGSLIRKIRQTPIININPNAGVNISQIKPLSTDEIARAFNQAKTFHLNRINSKGWEQRARNAGFTDVEIPKLRQELTTQLNKVQHKPLSEALKEFGLVAKINPNSVKGMKSIAHHYSLMKPGNTDINKILHGVELQNPNMTYSNAVDEFIHELGHGMTSGISTTAEQALKTTPRILLESKAYPLTQRLVDYNASLIPKQTVETLLSRNPRFTEKGLDYLLNYVGRGQEQLARSYVGQRHINNLYGVTQKAGKPFEYKSAVAYLRNQVPNMQQLNWYGGNADINMYQKALGLAAPIGIGLSAYGLSNNQNNVNYG